MTSVTPSARAGRSCGSCSLCCKLLSILELNKPGGQWCPHCAKRGGCGIYEARPGECQTFNCNWLTTPAIGDEWQPLRSRMVLHHVMDDSCSKLVVHVDPGSPLIWRNEPYLSQLRKWAQKLEEQNGLVNLYIGKRVVVVLPNKEVDLGVFNPGDEFNYNRRRVGSGWEYEFVRPQQTITQTPNPGM